MKIQVKRLYRGAIQRNGKLEEYTIGKVYVDGKYFSDSLEDKERDLNKTSDKVYGETAIPRGVYKFIVSFSPKFKRETIELLDVPYFKYIRMHALNYASESEGCIGVGENKYKGSISNSRYYEDKLTKMAKEAIARGDKEYLVVVE